ncbi:MAG TPA: carbohydrate-binding family 9-like protein [Flavisolibacter sp.]|nr:carbohydrate-binding family 9-like protein [Flavisolibacter sp.]
MQLKVSFLANGNESPESLSITMDKLDRHAIHFSPWKNFTDEPKANFSIAYNQDKIYLKYYVTEKTIRAAVNNTNGAVWEDSCVEFFIAFDDTGYYNIEVNCIGILLTGFGKGKERQLLDPCIVEQIKCTTCMVKKEDGSYHWELLLCIPQSLFIHHQHSFQKGLKCRANFYKCGDALPEPHFKSWSNIEASEPNFHLPEFFGMLEFE